MCTLTWRAAGGGGYDLFFNRDERDARAAEFPPKPGRTAGGTGYVAPEDGDHGGTWLLLNAHGVTVCVLNYYPRGVVETGEESRGRLPHLCAECAVAEEVPRVLRDGMQAVRFAPFHLVAVDAAGDAVHLRWDGRAVHEAPAPEFLTSSSFEPVRVQAGRAERFAALAERSVETLRAFHRGHDPEAGADSVCMRRADARTRSLCAVRVRADLRELTYETMTWTDTEAAMPVVLRL
ncbi:MAG: hypothetical protein K0R17_3310 [Rariglobus sp.]|jgi:hypothetical protein|nr:hypothetical protein [Rariglobus sp.]